MTLSAIVLTHNNEQTLKNCLSSLKFVDEIIVIDDHSTDRTLDIARRFDAKIYKRNLNSDYAAQRNFGLTKASSDWIIFIDSDEIVPKKLQKEILASIDSNKYSGFYLKRTDIFLGKTLEHGETASIKLLRLAKKKAGTWHRPVHEYWDIKGDRGELNTPIIHNRDLTFSQFITRLNHYTDIDTKALLKENKPFSYFDLFLKPPGKFIYNYFYLLGFLDGFPGFVMAFSMSLHSLVDRVKLRTND